MFQIASKTFATQWFFTDPLNHKTVNKTICRAPSANPPDYGHISGKTFELLRLFFEAFRILLIYLAKHFWSILNSPNLITQHYFLRAM